MRECPSPNGGVICWTYSVRNAVIPAKAGIHCSNLRKCGPTLWIPAFAGMTGDSNGSLSQVTPIHGSAGTQNGMKSPPRGTLHCGHKVCNLKVELQRILQNCTNEAGMSMKTKERCRNRPPLAPPYPERGIPGSPPRMRRGSGGLLVLCDLCVL
jgi:hypothetical protein